MSQRTIGKSIAIEPLLLVYDRTENRENSAVILIIMTSYVNIDLICKMRFKLIPGVKRFCS